MAAFQFQWSSSLLLLTINSSDSDLSSLLSKPSRLSCRKHLRKAALHVLCFFSKAIFRHLVLPCVLRKHLLSPEPFCCSENTASIHTRVHSCPRVKGITLFQFFLS